MRTFNFVPKCTQGALEMGLNLFSTIKLFSFGWSLQEQFVGLNCFDYQIVVLQANFLDILVNGCENMSDMTCCSHFIHS